MDNNFDNLKTLLNYIKSIGFFSRLFCWRKVKDLLVDAVSDFQKAVSNLDNLNEKIIELKNSNSGLSKDLDLAKTTVINQANDINNLKTKNQEQATNINTLTGDIASKDTTIINLRERVNELENELGLIKQKNDQLTTENKNNSGELATTKESLTKITDRKNELEIVVEGLKKDLSTLQSERDELKKANTRLLTEEENRKQDYEKKIATLDSTQTRIETEREQEKEIAYQKELQRFENLKATWKNHQDTVKLSIKSICSKHTITYVDKVPFKGDPDNTLEISEEYIVFDAKSPKGDDLNNFPTYLQQQAEAAKKYAKIENVKRWIFFVVPSNTYEVLDRYVYNLADYDVFIVTLNSIEPIILSLKKIEEYDFANQLSPEERENICRVLGKFAHLSKRRIQVDYYFIKQFIELAYQSESDLPPDILEDVKQFEKADKLNPPIERRAKAIPIIDLTNESIKIKNEANTQGILIQEETLSEQINKMPLYADGEPTKND
jgi:predicted  nucleic acid-binding Zn-ribbon protein